MEGSRERQNAALSMAIPPCYRFAMSIPTHITTAMTLLRRGAPLLCLLLLGATHAQPAKGFNDLGTVYFQEGRFADALERFGQAHKLAPEIPAIRRNMALCHQALANEAMENDDLNLALEHLNKAIELEPRLPAPHAQAGAYLFAAERLKEAQPFLEQALKLDNSQLDARAMLGEIAYRANDHAKAETHWKIVLEAKPDWPGLAQRLEKLRREAHIEGDFKRYPSAHFEISFGDVLTEATLSRIFDILETAYQEIGTELGGVFPSETVEVVLYDGVQFAEATQSDPHVGALFDGKIRAPITNKEGRFLQNATLKSRLRHEYVHVVLRHRLGAKVPWWFNEGLAETLSRKMDQSRLRLVRTAFRSEETLSFQELESNPRGQLSPEQVSLAYAQSHVAVAQLWNEGNAKFPALLEAFDKSPSYEDALKSVLNTDYATLEKLTETATNAE